MKTLSLAGQATLLGIEVIGAGVQEANGFYPTASNKVLDRFAFVKEDGSGYQVAYTLAPPDTWLLSDSLSTPLYEIGSDSSLPPEDEQWSTILGSNPAPTIKHVYTDPANLDLHLDTAGNLAIATEAEGLRQKLQTRLKLYQGEWFLNSGAGVPYLQSILGRAQISSDLKGSVAQILDIEILKEPEVLSILRSEAEFNAAGRRYTYTAELETVYGTMNLEGINNG